MKIKFIKLIALLAVACIAFSCNNSKDIPDDIDRPKTEPLTIENLHAQPLPVIQKCVEGKWKWILITFYGFFGGGTLNNTFINITEDEVVVTQEGYDIANLSGTFTYCWEEKKTLSGYTTYVMWNKEQDRGEWFFDKILNDTLYVYNYNANPGGYSNLNLFRRIK